jgi:hypothetical protein
VVSRQQTTTIRCTQQWIGSAAGRDPDSSMFLKKALTQNNTFQSAEIKKGILLVMSER